MTRVGIAMTMVFQAYLTLYFQQWQGLAPVWTLTLSTALSCFLLLMREEVLEEGEVRARDQAAMIEDLTHVLIDQRRYINRLTGKA